jgi:hypothetical protein
MKWFRLIVGWMLVAIACAIVVILAIVAIVEAWQPQEKQTPGIAFLIGGMVFGVCPAFLGWTLLRRRVPSVMPQSVPTAPSAADQVSPAVDAQATTSARRSAHQCRPGSAWNDDSGPSSRIPKAPDPTLHLP